ncbi:hypothetical protein TNCV_3580071 [Trichonephila clavipes]|nr:hypothetical protein TNCV_3580071 [Trichonephila clavipes]
MDAVDFRHHEDPPGWDGIKPATLVAEGQQQTNYANGLHFNGCLKYKNSNTNSNNQVKSCTQMPKVESNNEVDDI